MREPYCWHPDQIDRLTMMDLRILMFKRPATSGPVQFSSIKEAVEYRRKARAELDGEG